MVVPAEVSRTTQMIAILRCLVAELWSTDRVAALTAPEVVLDGCRKRQIRSLNELQMKVTLVAVLAVCCALIPGTSINRLHPRVFVFELESAAPDTASVSCMTQPLKNPCKHWTGAWVTAENVFKNGSSPFGSKCQYCLTAVVAGRMWCVFE